MPSSTPALAEFLASPNRPPETLSYHELQGFLFAVASAPEAVPPTEWLPIIFNEQDPHFATQEEAQHVFDQLRATYNDINAGVLSEHPALPADCIVQAAPLANLEPTAPLAAWSRGFTIGHQWLQELWDVEMDEELDEEIGAVLGALSFFASPRIADTLYRESTAPEMSFEAMAGSLISLFPEAMASYAHIGRTVLAEAEADDADDTPLH